MSNLISPRPRAAIGSGGSKKHFSIVASQFNITYVQGLIDHVTSELRALAPGASTALTHVPGSFEIPVVVRELALQKRGDAIIAIGVILKGETNHAENLSRSVTDALQRIAVAHGVPVINAVLTFDDEEQARARCLENEINRGTEAARAAVEISSVISKLRSK
jgi:6,7-dimethyl-8-ribityllumazine synthase